MSVPHFLRPLALSQNNQRFDKIAGLWMSRMKLDPTLVAVALLFCCAVSGTAQTPADAMEFEHQGKWQEAAEAWKTITVRNPSDAGAFASLGVALSKDQKFREAASAYRKALDLNPKLPGVQLNLGLAEFKQGNFKPAAAALRTALAADPSNAQARTLLGLSYYGAHEFAEAIKYLEPATKSDPGNLELHHLLAQSCLWAKNYSCALEEFRLLLQQNPDSAETHTLMGEALDGLGKTPEAIAEFQAAAQASPREPNVHFGLGYLYWKSHQYDDAKREFEAELALDPDHAQALAYLGDIAMKKNDPDAVTLLRKSMQKKSDIRIAAIDLGVILAQLKQYPEAVVALQRAVALDPAEPDAHYRLAHVYQEMGKTAESQKEFAKVRELREKADRADEDMVRKMSSSPPSLSSPQAERPN
jgi:tetratricopeptide (TPR) repeat protein